MQTPIIISNTKAYIQNLKEFFKLQNDIWINLEKENYKYCVAVPNSLISLISKEEYKGFTVGSQGFYALENGAHTGMESVENIIDAGAKFVILGHSEVRERGESSEQVAKKVEISLSKNLHTVLCVGERERFILDDKFDTNYIDELLIMLKNSLKNVNKNNISKLIIAYEPVWAIGTNTPATPDVVMQSVIVIRRELAKMFGMDSAKKIKILYGGSVDEENAKEYIKNATCDGVLVGRSSMNAKIFAKMINNIYEK